MVHKHEDFILPIFFLTLVGVGVMVEGFLGNGALILPGLGLIALSAGLYMNREEL